mmetsp:Transcript_124184/g.247435  ORF Transcript_124184/g.247435 Transcript_124184/m.247435 type:complete len:205 (+) Transcript_124184:823-1437(+)
MLNRASSTWPEPTPGDPCNSAYFMATFRKTTRRPETTGALNCNRLPPWCLASTPTALRRLVIVCTKSVSVSVNLRAAFSRRAVAVFKEAVSSAICFFRASMVVASSPTSALRSSISAVRSRSLASASAMAFVFSFSLVSHQQTILSYISESLLLSASSSAFIFFNRFTTRFKGLTVLPPCDNSWDHARCRARCRAVAASVESAV